MRTVKLLRHVPELKMGAQVVQLDDREAALQLDKGQAVDPSVLGEGYVSGEYLSTQPQALTSGQRTQARINIDLANVDNTSDMDKPISTAVAFALQGKASYHPAMAALGVNGQTGAPTWMGQEWPAAAGIAPHTHPMTEIDGLSSELAFLAAEIANASPLGHQHGDADITSLSASKITGVLNLAQIPAAALERLVIVPNAAARLGLTLAHVQLGDVVKQTDTGYAYFVKDESSLGTEGAFEVFTAGGASSVPWSGVTDKPTFATVATSGQYSDLAGKPTLGAVAALSSILISDVTNLTTTLAGKQATLSNATVLGQIAEDGSLKPMWRGGAWPLTATPSFTSVTLLGGGGTAVLTTNAENKFLVNGSEVSGGGGAGTISRSQAALSYAASIALPAFSATDQILTLSATGNFALTTQGRAAGGNCISVVITNSTGGSVTPTWEAWLWAGQKPTIILPGEVWRVNLQCLGTAVGNIHAAAARFAL